MARYGFKTVSGNFSTGNPDVTSTEALRECAGAFAGTFTGVHQYGWPSIQADAPWYSLRHRFLVSARKTMGRATNPVLITECGLDGTQHGRGGWRDVCSWEAYKAQLLWYDAELAKDKNVLAAFVFTSGAWGDRWASFDVDEAQWRNLLGG
jgi:hypothetical protein